MASSSYYADMLSFHAGCENGFMLSPLRKSLSRCEVIDIIVVVIGFSLEGYGSVGSIAIKSVLEQPYPPLHKIDQIEDGTAYRDKPAKVLHLGGVDRLMPDGLCQILWVLYLALVPILLRHEKHIVDVYSKDIARQTVNLDYLHFAMNNIGRKNTNSKSQSGLFQIGGPKNVHYSFRHELS